MTLHGQPGSEIRFGTGAARRRTAAALALLLVAVVYPGASRAWDVKTGIQLGVTASDNARLQSDSVAESDVFFDISPSIRVTQDAARFQADLSYVPRIVYSPFDSGDTDTQNTLAAVGKLEAVPDTILIDADASISQNFLSPFGATPLDDGSRSDNFTETTVFGLSPAWIGQLGSDMRYETRYRWKSVSADASSTQNSVATEWSAFLDKAVVRNIGWNLRFQRRATDYSFRPDTSDQRYIATLTYRVNSELRVSGRGGYETNNFSQSSKSTTNYGAGVNWAPSTRSSLSANWDHRYFGEAYNAELSHRFKRSRLRLTASRDASTFAERFLDAGLINFKTGDLLITERLDRLYPDPANRTTVEQYLRSQGYANDDLLLGIYTDQVNVRENLQLSYEIFGGKNTLTLSVYRRSVETVIENFSPNIPADLGLNSNNNQKGFIASHAYRITSLATLNFQLSRSNTVSTIPGNNGESTEDSLRGSVTQRLSAKTSVTLGARYRNLDSNVGLGFTERAVFGTINHSF